jgi:hypothetical protein
VPRSESSSDEDVSSDASLEPIPALPHHLLPEYYTHEATHQRGEAVPPEPPPLKRPVRAATGEGEQAPRKKKRRAQADDAATTATAVKEEAAAGSDRPVCVTCGLRFTSAAQLEEHTRGKKHRQNERALRLGPAAAQGRPPSQRPPPVELEVRRQRMSWRVRMPVLTPPHCDVWFSSSHQGPSCGLCRKAFTSDAQLQEHIGGKWHQMRMRGELSRRPAGNH